VIDAATDIEQERGCGIVVGFDDRNIIILTARHIVKNAIETPNAFRVGVLFYGTTWWVDAKIGSAIERLGDVDAAYITVPRSKSNFEAEPPLDRIAVARTPPTGGRISAYGFDPNTDDVRWAEASAREPRDGKFGFDGGGVVGGFSGGAVADQFGIIAMTIQASPLGEPHVALLLEPLLVAMQSMDLPVKLRPSSVREALANMHANSLVGGAELWSTDAPPGVMWWAVQPIRLEQGELVAHVISTSARSECTIAASSHGATMTFRRNAAFISEQSEPGRVNLVIDPAQELPGFVVLSSRLANGQKLYVALPTERTELLGARVLATNARENAAAQLGERAYASLNLHIDRANKGLPVPFAVCCSTSMELECVLPQAVLGRQKAVTLRWNQRFPDAAFKDVDAAWRERAKLIWERFTFRFGEETTAIDWTEGWREVRLLDAAAGERLTFTHSGVDAGVDWQGIDNGVLLLQGAMLRYE
jgi:hypothetical protein